MAWADNLVLIDNYNRASLGANWIAPDNGCGIVSNRLKALADDRACYYIGQAFGPSLKLAIQLLGDGLVEIYCPMVMDGENPFVYGYFVRVVSYSYLWMMKMVGGDNDIQIGTSLTNPVWTPGDWLGVERRGNSFDIYRATSFPNFAFATTFNDSQFADQAGYVGAGFAYTTYTGVDDLYVATISSAPVGVPELTVS